MVICTLYVQQLLCHHFSGVQTLPCDVIDYHHHRRRPLRHQLETIEPRRLRLLLTLLLFTLWTALLLFTLWTALLLLMLFKTVDHTTYSDSSGFTPSVLNSSSWASSLRS